jgi:demethylmenaquinone methyltransferase/2-methoxy-6-polyprenyl-1,4-benzoquinol methylase
MAGPNSSAAKAKYRGLASRYNRLVERTENLRRQAVDLLQLRPGDVVFDVACGTGLSFPLIEEGIGPEGTLVGVDLSPEMLAKARERVAEAGWQNVRLIETAIEGAEIPVEADAVFFHFTHDVMRSPAALDAVFRHARPGARVVTAGGKWAPWWALPVNAYMWRVARQYVTTFEGYDRPWSLLAGYLNGIEVRPALAGAAYVAWGVAKPAASMAGVETAAASRR